jgi:hypothetical protein
LEGTLVLICRVLWLHGPENLLNLRGVRKCRVSKPCAVDCPLAFVTCHLVAFSQGSSVRKHAESMTASSQFFFFFCLLPPVQAGLFSPSPCPIQMVTSSRRHVQTSWVTPGHNHVHSTYRGLKAEPANLCAFLYTIVPIAIMPQFL